MTDILDLFQNPLSKANGGRTGAQDRNVHKVHGDPSTGPTAQLSLKGGFERGLFITGANGWLGRNLVEYILQNKKTFNINPSNINVFCRLDENSDFLENLKVKIFSGNIKNIPSIQNFLQKAKGGIVIHLAGIIHPTIKTSDFFDINYLGTKHIIEISQKVGVDKIIIMSSNSSIGCNKSNKNEDIFIEESPFNPYMEYGKSKFLMENYLRNFISHNKYPEVTIIRSPWFYGPNQPSRQTLFFKMIQKGKFPIIGSGQNRRSMVYTENLAQGIMLAAFSKISGGKTYWIADEESHSMNDIIHIIQMVMRTEFNINCKNSDLRLPSIISDMAYVADIILQYLGLYQQKIHVLSEMNKNIFCSIKKAKEELGYKPEFDLYNGIKNSIDWCLKNNIKF